MLLNLDAQDGQRPLQNVQRTPAPLEVIKWKEVYEITEGAIDRCEDVANTIEGIVVKNA